MLGLNKTAPTFYAVDMQHQQCAKRTNTTARSLLQLSSSKAFYLLRPLLHELLVHSH